MILQKQEDIISNIVSAVGITQELRVKMRQVYNGDQLAGSDTGLTVIADNTQGGLAVNTFENTFGTFCTANFSQPINKRASGLSKFELIS